MSANPQVPLWLLASCFLATLVIAREIGFAFARRRTVDADAKGDAFAMTAVLGLLALLIGFTYAVALQRYYARREAVIAEANALGTTWLRTQLLDEPDRTRVRAILRKYVAARISYGNAPSDRDELVRYQQSDALQQELWQAVLTVVEPFKQTSLASLLAPFRVLRVRRCTNCLSEERVELIVSSPNAGRCGQAPIEIS